MGLKEWNDLQLPARVSLVGAGGKTTVMYALACRLAKEGKRVLVTTTTHIYMPHSSCLASTPEEVRQLWDRGSFAVAGSLSAKPGKLTRPGQIMHAFFPEADVVLVEADGARHHPVKVPRQGEPVIPPESEMVLALMGLSALGQPLESCCFGLEEALQLLGVQKDHHLTEADAAVLLASSRGGRKAIGNRRFGVILNQCDSHDRRDSAARIAAALQEQGIEEVYTAAFDEKAQRFYDHLAGTGENGAEE